MKKIVSIVMIIAFLLLFSGCGCLGAFDEEAKMKNKVENNLGVSVEGAAVVEYWDNHGGFHGDGEAFVKLSCEEDFEKGLDLKWRSLPLEGEAYRYFYEWGGLFEHPETGERVIPEIENGYWYFESTGAMNWIFALYDCDENILYFYEYDS